MKGLNSSNNLSLVSFEVNIINDEDFYGYCILVKGLEDFHGNSFGNIQRSGFLGVFLCNFLFVIGFGGFM